MIKKIVGIALVALLTVTCAIGIFLYVNSFRVYDLSGYRPPVNNFVLYNYKEYPLEKRSFYRTTYVSGTAEINTDTALVVLAVKDARCAENDTVEAGAVLGTDGSGQNVLSPVKGRVLSMIEKADGTEVTLLDFQKILVRATVEGALAKHLELSKAYSAALADTKLDMTLRSMRYDLETGSFSCLFQPHEIPDSVFIYNNMEMRIELYRETFVMTCVEKSAMLYYEFLEGKEHLLYVKDSSGGFSRKSFLCSVLADEYIGLAYYGIDNVEGSKICFVTA